MPATQPSRKGCGRAALVGHHPLDGVTDHLRRDELPSHDTALPWPHGDDLSFLELFFVVRHRSRQCPAADGCPADAEQCCHFGRSVLDLGVKRGRELVLHQHTKLTSGIRLVELAHERHRGASTLQKHRQLCDVAGREQAGLALLDVQVRQKREQVLHLTAVGDVELFLRFS